MAASEILPGHVASDSGVQHSADHVGLSAGHGSLWYQGTEYTILDESAPRAGTCLSQGDPILELVFYPEALQLALLRWLQLTRQSARAPPHSMSTCTPNAGAPSMVRSSPMDLSLGALPLKLHGPRNWMGDPRLLDWAPITLLRLP